MSDDILKLTETSLARAMRHEGRTQDGHNRPSSRLCPTDQRKGGLCRSRWAFQAYPRA